MRSICESPVVLMSQESDISPLSTKGERASGNKMASCMTCFFHLPEKTYASSARLISCFYHSTCIIHNVDINNAVWLQGSGPFGIPLAQDMRRITARLEASLGRSWPEIQELLQVGGAVEARGMLVNALMSRYNSVLFLSSRPFMCRLSLAPVLSCMIP